MKGSLMKLNCVSTFLGKGHFVIDRMLHIAQCAIGRCFQRVRVLGSFRPTTCAKISWAYPGEATTKRNAKRKRRFSPKTGLL